MAHLLKGLKLMSQYKIYISLIIILILFLYGCDKITDSKNDLYTIKVGICKTGESSVILEDDPDDWQPRSNSQTSDLLTVRPAYPNPSNISWGIYFKFQVMERGIVKININNKPNHVIATIIDCELAPGMHVIKWYFKNDLGEDVPKGIYRVFIHLKISENEEYQSYGDIQLL